MPVRTACGSFPCELDATSEGTLVNSHLTGAVTTGISFRWDNGYLARAPPGSTSLSGLMEISLTNVVLNSISSFSDLSSHDNVTHEPALKYYRKVEEILKLLKPVLDVVFDAGIASEERFQKAFAELGHSVNELKEIFGNFHPLTSKIYFGVASKGGGGTGSVIVLEVGVIDSSCILNTSFPLENKRVGFGLNLTYDTGRVSVDHHDLFWWLFLEDNLELDAHMVLQAETLISKIRPSVVEIFEWLKYFDCLPLELNASSLELCVQKILQIGVEQTPAIISQAIREQVDGSGPSSESLAKFEDHLGLRSNLELLIEAVALEKLKENAEQAEENCEAVYFDQMIALVTHMHEGLVLIKQSDSSNPIPAYYCCPLSLELMRDPVVVASGQTYERGFIKKWIDLGLTVCPKTRQTMAHTNFIPNYVVKSQIAIWCETNNVKLPDPMKPISFNNPCSIAYAEKIAFKDIHILPHSRSSKPESTRSNGSPGNNPILSGGIHSEGTSSSHPLSSTEGSLPVIAGYGHAFNSGEQSVASSQDPVSLSRTKVYSAGGDNEQFAQCHNRSASISSTLSGANISQDMLDNGNEVLSQVTAYNSDTSWELTSSEQQVTSTTSTSPKREPKFPRRLETRSRSQTMWRRPSNGFVPKIVLSSAIGTRADLSGVEAHVRNLVEDLKGTSFEVKRTATAELRLLAKHNADNRIVIANSGAIDLLVDLLRSTDAKIQEESVTALLYLSINDNSKTSIAHAGAIEPLIHVLETGTPEAKENSAATLFSLSVIEDNKVRIGRSGAIKPLVELLGHETPRGKKYAATALFSSSIFHENKGRIVHHGAVKYLVELMDPAAGMVDKAVAVLANLATIPEGRTAIGQEGGIPVLVEVIELGSARGKEHAAAALLQLCINRRRFCSMCKYGNFSLSFASGLMEISLTNVVLNSISSFFDLSSHDNVTHEPALKYYRKVEEILKLFKPVLDAGIASEELLQKAFAELGHSVSELKELFGNLHPLTSKIYFGVTYKGGGGSGVVLEVEVIDIGRSVELICTSPKGRQETVVDLVPSFEPYGFFPSGPTEYTGKNSFQLVVQAETLISKIQASVVEIFEWLKSFDRLPLELDASSLELCVQKIKQIGLEQTSAIISQAISEQVDGSGPSSESLAKFEDHLSLRSNQELLIEAVALEKLKENAEQAEENSEADYFDQMIALVTHMHEGLVKVKQSESSNPIPTPADFCCPLSLELMRDPVIVASGQTYERGFIKKWIDLGLTVCPKTRQTMAHTNLIPNYTVKALIANWCETNNVKLPDPMRAINFNHPSSTVYDEKIASKDAHILPHSRSSKPESTRANGSPGNNLISSGGVHCEGTSSTHPHTSTEGSLPVIAGNGHALNSGEQSVASSQDPVSPSRTEVCSAGGDNEQLAQCHNRSASVSSMLSGANISQGMLDNGNEVSSQVTAYNSDTSGELTSLEQQVTTTTTSTSTSPKREPKFPRKLETRSRSQTMWRRPSNGFVPKIVLSSAIETRADLSGVEAQVRNLVEDLKGTSFEVKRTATAELRLLAKHNTDNRIVIANSGAIDLLVDLLRSTDTKIQEESVTALLNLSINDNNKTAIANANAIEPLIHVLETGTPEAKENSAATLFSLSVIEDNKVRIGRSGAIKPLVELLGNGSPRGKKDASTALFNLSIFHENKPRIVEAGAVKYLVELMDPAAGMVDKAVAVLANLATIPEGRTAIGQEGGIPVLVEVVELGSTRGKEHAAAALLQLCITSNKFCSLAQALLSCFKNQRHGNPGRG
ncbi:hypothetical protein RHGRI_023348 [Rhododendron griersonianum]|uniref:RING-type E3 ubiquitin transferase n=1 Tax=Rhododendron griersonianum TaxID=479676 RepID=A0AAV6J8P0_9ERIC|nr:hypothetical protein RHGRI_023348 [Rhododendron griersonianum]